MLETNLLMHWEILLFFFGIAILYSSIGFGGGSSYLAILALYGLEPQLLRATALLCNITVVSGGIFIFYKNDFFKWHKVWPLILFSIPMAYIGGRIQLQEKVFFILLGTALIVAAFLMWIQVQRNDDIQSKTNKSSVLLNSSLGAGIGFLSGLVGIGGGIFLAPVLHLLRWDKAKIIAATSSGFILVNSIAGLLGQFSHGPLKIDWSFVLSLMACVFIGGQIGSHLGAKQFRQIIVRRLTSFLIFFVACRILFKYLF